MMKRTITTLLIAGTLSFVGCDNDKAAKKGVSDAPPPAPAEAAPAANPLPTPAPVAVTQTPAPKPLPAPKAPAAADAKPAAKAAASNAKTYVVEKGDTLFSISRKLYGNNAKVKEILAANPGLDPDVIKVGQKLNLP